jgi:hypothetical protein
VFEHVEMKRLLAERVRQLRRSPFWIQEPKRESATLAHNTKTASNDFLGRFREVVSDPLNLLIDRDPQAGMVEDGLVAA